MRAGHAEQAAQRFVETVAFGAGAWATLPEPIRATFIRNAPTFLDETNDPEGLALVLGSLARFDKPALVTKGTESPTFLGPIASLVADALPHARTYVFEGAGHVPHISHPKDYAETVGHFCAG